MALELPVVNVALGVLVLNKQKTPSASNKRHVSFFVCRRQAHQHQGNKWEFPGGKIEANETAEQALTRELAEEIGIQVLSSTVLTKIEFHYPDKHVNLHVRMVDEFTGKAHGAEGQEAQWVDFSTLKSLEFPAANQQIIQALQSHYKDSV